MKKLILILKGITSYLAIIMTTLTILTIDSLYDNNVLFIGLTLNVLGWIIVIRLLSKEELKQLLFIPDNLEEL